VGILDRLMGAGAQRPKAETQDGEMSADEQAIARYRYMLRTAPPETIEQAHAEAFARLTPEQRRKVLEELGRELPEREREAALRAGDDPASLARVATRAEVRQPGAIERAFGGFGTAPGYGAPAYAGAGFGGLMAGSFLSSMAGTVLGSMIAQHFFTHQPDANRLFGGDTDRFGSGSLDQAGSQGPIEDPFKSAGFDNGDNGDDLAGDFDDGGGFDSGDSFDV